MTGQTADIVRDCFLQEGFVAVGFLNKTECKFGSWISNWLQSGYQAGMQWMEQYQTIRQNPCAIEAYANTIISAAISYKTEPPAGWSSRNPISNYAWGEDYHLVVKRKLQTVKKRLELQIPWLKSRICVDTAPLAEKVIARQSGLGWVGKNAMLINRRYGSYLFLGELITNLDLPSGKPTKGYCGTCRKCIDTCPTNAILPNGVINSNRCISYLTIEKRGDFSEAEKSWIDYQLFGCDICQQVCPWNRKAPVSKIEAFACSEQWTKLELNNPAVMTIELYNELKIKSSIKRTKYLGLLRNLKAVADAKRSMKP